MPAPTTRRPSPRLAGCLAGLLLIAVGVATNMVTDQLPEAWGDWIRTHSILTVIGFVLLALAAVALGEYAQRRQAPAEPVTPAGPIARHGSVAAGGDVDQSGSRTEVHGGSVETPGQLRDRPRQRHRQPARQPYPAGSPRGGRPAGGLGAAVPGAAGYLAAARSPAGQPLRDRRVLVPPCGRLPRPAAAPALRPPGRGPEPGRVAAYPAAGAAQRPVPGGEVPHRLRDRRPGTCRLAAVGPHRPHRAGRAR